MAVTVVAVKCYSTGIYCGNTISSYENKDIGHVYGHGGRIIFYFHVWYKSKNFLEKQIVKTGAKMATYKHYFPEQYDDINKLYVTQTTSARKFCTVGFRDLYFNDTIRVWAWWDEETYVLQHLLWHQWSKSYPNTRCCSS